MKKQNRMALLPVFLILALGTGVALTFQNCSNVKFQTEKGANPVALAQGKSCVDASGVEHQNSTEWNEQATGQNDVSCADSPTSKQGYRDTTRFVCDDGTVTNMGTLSELVEPMSSCPAPVLSAAASPSRVANGGSTSLVVSSAAVHDVKYSCKSVATTNELFKGDLAVGNVTKALNPIVEDLSCSVVAQTSSAPITKSFDVTVDCESSGKIKDPNTHMCVEFSCKSFTVLHPDASTGLIDVPARTSAGICYTVKLMDKIDNSNSDLNSTHDDQVISARHGGPGGSWNPWVMGRSNVEFIMRAGGGARQVKLSGDDKSISPIRVDNFLISGLAKKSVGLSPSYYRAYGTTDSAVPGSNSVLFGNDKDSLPVMGFGPNGTATVTALDLTTMVSTEESYLLDLRALDCGGSRELSDIWLLFQ